MYVPTTELGKLLLVLVEEVGGIAPMAFKDINVVEALKQADQHPRSSTVPISPDKVKAKADASGKETT